MDNQNRHAAWALAAIGCATASPAPPPASVPPATPRAASVAAPPAPVASQPKPEPASTPDEDACMVYHYSMGQPTYRGDADAVPAAAALAEFENPAQEAACARLKKRFAPKTSADDAPTCLVRARGGDPGVWAIVLDRYDKPARWTIVRVALGGSSAVGPWIALGADSSGSGEIVAITDYGSDGSPEVLTRSFTSTDSAGGHTQRFSIWTLDGGKIKPYNTAVKARIVGLVDQDGDELPDLMLDPYGITVGSSNGWAEGLQDWTLLAHATKSGQFSLTDSVAKDYARALCPKAPDLARALRVSDRCYARVAHCARLWGTESAALERGLEAACKDADPISTCAGSGPAFHVIATTPPPFVLTTKP